MSTSKREPVSLLRQPSCTGNQVKESITKAASMIDACS
jgi:hypothetical protein